MAGRGQKIFNSIVKGVTLVAGGATIADKVKGKTQKIIKVRAEVVKLRQLLQPI
jgi:hypothetical protein